MGVIVYGDKVVNRRIGMSSKINWILEQDISINNDIIDNVQSYFGVVFPNDYRECILKNDGGYPTPNRFKCQGKEEVFNNLIGIGSSADDMIQTYEDVADRIIAGIIPFAEDPFGNLICFDYRQNNKTKVVFWDHEKAIDGTDSAISFICNTFSDLLNMLRETQE